MKNIFKNSKRGIAAILTLCILLGIAGTCVYAASIPEENTAHTEETTQELMPMMARGCENDYNHIFGNPEHNLDGFVGYYGGDQAMAYAAVLGVAQTYVTNHGITGIINAFNQITVNVSGFNITFRGNVINGRLHIGTFFII